jgi:hypothetical protein
MPSALLGHFADGVRDVKAPWPRSPEDSRTLPQLPLVLYEAKNFGNTILRISIAIELGGAHCSVMPISLNQSKPHAQSICVLLQGKQRLALAALAKQAGVTRSGLMFNPCVLRLRRGPRTEI